MFKKAMMAGAMALALMTATTACGGDKKGDANDSTANQTPTETSTEPGTEPATDLTIIDEEDNIEVSDEDTSDATSNASIDEYLNMYDAFVTKYISYAKKAATGDMSALTELAGLMEQADDLDKQGNALEGDMTAAQIKRYAEIQQKMLDAASSMQ